MLLAAALIPEAIGEVVAEECGELIGDFKEGGAIDVDRWAYAQVAAARLLLERKAGTLTRKKSSVNEAST